MGDRMFTKVIQIAFVVRDLDAAVGTYSKVYGIGPWKISEISSNTVEDLYKHDSRTDFSYRVAMCDIGDLEWELVQPLDDGSIYSDFLKEKGPGLHHVAFATDDYDKAGDAMRSGGKRVLSSGNWDGLRFAHFDTEDDLGFVLELFKFPDR